MTVGRGESPAPRGLAARSGLRVTIREADVHPLQLQGPLAREVARALFGEPILELKYYFFRETDVAGIPVVVTRTGWTSEIGYEIYLLDPSRGTELWERILAAGRPFDLRPTGPSDIRRIEGGILNWGADMTDEHNPFEVGLGRLVDFDMPGDCVALEALGRIRSRGVERRLAGVVLEGDPFPALNFTKWPAQAAGRRVGPVTSAVYSPRLRQNIGYCWLPADLAEPGTEVEVDSEWGRRSARVTPMPFVDPEKRIPVS